MLVHRIILPRTCFPGLKDILPILLLRTPNEVEVVLRTSETVLQFLLDSKTHRFPPEDGLI